jgi:multicomponent Na+:H+ antiporter subunit D
MPNPHLILLPILVPLTGAALALLLRRWPRAQAGFAFGALLTALAASGYLLFSIWTTGRPVVFQLGAWAAPFGISLVGDLLSATMALMCQLVIAACALYALGSRDTVATYPTFYPLLLTLTTGLTGGMLTGDLFNLFVFAELLVISGAALTALSDDRLGVEAAFKYFYISTLAGVCLLIACGSLYISYGTLNMADLAQRIAAAPDQPLAGVALALLVGFFMVKSAVAPFHFWQPDFHTTAPTAISALLSSVVVKLGVYGFIRLTTLLYTSQREGLAALLILLGVVGLFLGGLGAAGTHNVKRMLAYSTLGQIGYILIAIGWGTPLALAAAVVFAFNHALLKSALLMLAGYLASRAPVKTASFEAITGLGRYMPFAGVLFLLGGLGLVGIPPLNGFISKLLVFRSGVEAGDYLVLALAGVGSLISLVYVARAFERIWWQPLPEGAKAKPGGDQIYAPALLIALSLVLGLWGEPLLALANATAAWLGDPASYIQALRLTGG